MNEDLRAAERAFNDVHKKYERTKEAIGEFKRNEDALKVCARELWLYMCSTHLTP